MSRNRGRRDGRCLCLCRSRSHCRCQCCCSHCQCLTHAKGASSPTHPRALQLTWAFIRRTYARDEAAAREAFFSPDCPDDTVHAAFERLSAGLDAPPAVDVSTLDKELGPGRPVPRPAAADLPVLVIGAADDRVVDAEGVAATAAHFGVSAVTLPQTAHDIMLDTRWEASSTVLLDWLTELP